jgi:hypothetical protein
LLGVYRDTTRSFQSDTTAGSRTIKMLNTIDEFTRECPAIEVDRAIDADRVVDVLDCDRSVASSARSL